MQHYKHHSDHLRQAFAALEGREEFWRNFFITDRLHTNLRCHGGSLNTCTMSDLMVYFMKSCTSSTISVEEELPAPDFLDFIHLRFIGKRFHDNSSRDISSTTLCLETFRLPTFGILPHFSVWDCHASNFYVSKSLFSTIPTSTFTMNSFINLVSTETMIIQHSIVIKHCSMSIQSLISVKDYLFSSVTLLFRGNSLH